MTRRERTFTAQGAEAFDAEVDILATHALQQAVLDALDRRIGALLQELETEEARRRRERADLADKRRFHARIRHDLRRETAALWAALMRMCPRHPPRRLLNALHRLRKVV
jgi:hypothetical protein